jgi:DNA-directed RNA polymerase subunit RPC12/RpoP
MQTFSPLSQYLCSKCGSMLKETYEQIEISTIIEDCPTCGALLADTLTKQRKREIELTSLPRFQTAYDLTKFKIDIDKISKFMPLTTIGSLCIVGQTANLLLTRLCVRSLLPAKHGGLGSPFVIIVDAGNKSDFYQTVDFCKQYGLNLQNTLDRIIVSRTFTIYQLKSLLLRELPKVVRQYQAGVVIVPGLLDLFEDPNIKKKEAKKVISRIMGTLGDISDRLLVVASIQNSKYADWVMPKFEKRIVLGNTSRSGLAVDLYNEGHKASITLSQKELALVRRT